LFKFTNLDLVLVFKVLILLIFKSNLNFFILFDLTVSKFKFLNSNQPTYKVMGKVLFLLTIFNFETTFFENLAVKIIKKITKSTTYPIFSLIF